MNQISITSPENSYNSWEQIKDTALQTKNLTSDIRVGETSIDVVKGFFGRVKAFFGLVPSKDETLGNLKNHLETFFLNELSKFGDAVPGDRWQALATKAQNDLNQITEHLSANSSSTSTAIKEAHVEIQEALLKLKKEFCAQAGPTTEIHAIYEIDDQGKRTSTVKAFSILRPAADYENVSLSGGGKKGEVYGAVYEALTKAGVLKGVKNIAGSSAGAMAAAGMACGMDPEAFNAANESIKLYDLVTNSKDPDLNEALSLDEKSIGMGGSMATQKINQAIVASIKKFFTTEWAEDASKKDISDTDFAAANTLKENLNNAAGYLITFAELDLLQRINPAKFKRLTITGFNTKTKKTEYYNAENFSDMEIAIAVRTSMALPFFLKSVKHGGVAHKDGGIGSNNPVDALDEETKSAMDGLVDLSHSTKEDAMKASNGVLATMPKNVSAESVRAKTLVLVFEKDGEFSRVTAETNFTPTTKERLKAKASGSSSYQLANTADKVKLWNAGPNALPVMHGELGTVSFLAGQKKIDAARLQAKTAAWDWISARQDQATHEVFKIEKLTKILQAMTNDELEGISKTKTPEIISNAVRDEMRARGQLSQEDLNNLF